MSLDERQVRLGDLAHTRSGDKGDRSNIGVVANDRRSITPGSKTHLTERAVAEFLRPMGIGKVKRYEMPGLRAFNFIDRSRTGGRGEPFASDRHPRQGARDGAAGAHDSGTGRWLDRSANSRGFSSMSTNLIHPRRSRTRRDPHPQSPGQAQRAFSGARCRAARHARRVSVDERVRVVVLTGAGSAFCSGMDLKEAASADERSRVRASRRSRSSSSLPTCSSICTRLPKPTIAAVNGDALAGGAGLMAACDLAVAAETARIGYPEVKRGLVPSIVMHDLSRQIGDRRRRSWCSLVSLISAEIAA